MSYQFRRNEAAAQGLQRMAAEQVRQAHKELSSLRPTPEEAVHEARKRFKKVRALLRLARPSLGDTFTQENVHFRDMGRALSLQRDVEALGETFAALSTRFESRFSSALLSDIDRALTTWKLKVEETAPLETQLREVLPALEAARVRIPDWNLHGDGFDLLEDGLERILTQGRRAMKRARKQGATEAFHEWRKRVKDHWYHVTLLQRVWPAPMRGYARALKSLSDHLGDHHNLAVLREHLEMGEFLSAEGRDALLPLVEEELKRHAAAAFPLGAHVHAESAKAFTSRIRRYWEIWRVTAS